MLCPMISYRREGYGKIKCKKGECAWYNKNKEECCIKTFAENIEEVAEGQRTIFTREV